MCLCLLDFLVCACVRLSRGYLPLSEANHVPHSWRASPEPGMFNRTPAMSEKSTGVFAESKPVTADAVSLEHCSDVEPSRVSARRSLHQPGISSQRRTIDPTDLHSSTHIDLTSELDDSPRHTREAGFCQCICLLAISGKFGITVGQAVIRTAGILIQLVKGADW